MSFNQHLDKTTLTNETHDTDISIYMHNLPLFLVDFAETNYFYKRRIHCFL